eukprot:3591430-Pleurochrysis_carterae.AAC.2
MRNGFSLPKSHEESDGWEALSSLIPECVQPLLAGAAIVVLAAMAIVARALHVCASICILDGHVPLKANVSKSIPTVNDEEILDDSALGPCSLA